MIVGIKDGIKLAGISIVAFCAVFVCTLFLNYNIDIAKIEDLIQSEQIMQFYEVQVLMGKIVSAVSGGCLLLTSVVMLFFYIGHYIDAHKKDMGILKALGYSDFKIAKGFWVFGLSIFTGTALGYSSSFLLMPSFYETMNEKGILPDCSPDFNFVLLLCLVILPTVMFGLLSVLYGYLKLKCPVLELLKEKQKTCRKKKKESADASFLVQLRRNTIKTRPGLVFFIAFSAFCYSAMMQMSANMDDIASPMFAMLMLFIGVVLAFVTLLLAVTTVVRANAKNISLMKVFGYSFASCNRAILGGYRPIAYIGFAVGTIYQHALLKITLQLFESTSQEVPEYNFDFAVFAGVLVSFVIVYEIVMHFYSVKIKNISVKEIMLE